MGTDTPILNIIGEKVALGPLRKDLVPTYLRWINDFEVTKTLLVGLRPTTREAEEAWYERACKEENQVHFSIYTRPDLRPIGNTSLVDINHATRTAEFGILIGEKDCWGQGFGTETARLLLHYGFTALNLHSIRLRVYSHNERGIRAYLRAGFKEVGRWREAARVCGEVRDVVLMDCLASEHEGRADVGQ